MVSKSNDSTTLSCSFCGKKKSEVKKLIAGENGHICDVCVKLCAELLTEQGISGVSSSESESTCSEVSQSDSSSNDQVASSMFTPQEMVDFLDQYVCGQDKAKKTIAVAAYNHYKRLQSLQSKDVRLVKVVFY